MSLLTLSIGIAGALALLLALARLVRVDVGVSFRDLHATSMEAHERIGEYLRANFSGDPATLGPALRGLLPSVREIAARHGQTLDESLLRTVVASSVAAHHVASRAQAEAALDEALRLERGAA